VRLPSIPCEKGCRSAEEPITDGAQSEGIDDRSDKRRAADRDQSIERRAAGARGTDEPLKVGIFGSALDTGNFGVSALGISTVRGLQSGSEPVQCTLFDYGGGTRSVEFSDGEWQTSVRLTGLSFSRR